MKPLITFVFAPLAVAALVQSDQPKPILATVGRKLIRGVQLHDKVHAFLGIPYAQPPVENLRFLPPQPLNNTIWQRDDDEPLDATTFGPVCYQFMYKSVAGEKSKPTTPESEDCLSLNIFIPTRGRRKSSRLPVFVWSYGGGFVEGGSSVPIYNPTDFVARSEDIIVVTWNYRLNLFGFPNSPALTHQNLGIRDQRAALEWVRGNIAAFGGDPKRIVLGGQSAGADAGHAMMYSHRDDPIVSGLLLQSGTIQVANPGTEHTDAEFVRIAKAVGCDNTDRNKELRCMQIADPLVLKHAISNQTLNRFGSQPGGAPMVDNVTLFTLDEYARRGEAGEFAHIPMLLGSTADEGQGVINWQPDKGLNQTFARIITETIFTCNTLLNAGFHASRHVPVWRYLYNGVFPEVTAYPWLGAYHVADVPLLMGTYNAMASGKKSGGTTSKSSQLFQKLFAAFIRDPYHGLRTDFSLPMFRPNTSSLIELFANNTPTYRIVTPTADRVCQHPTPVPYDQWDEL